MRKLFDSQRGSDCYMQHTPVETNPSANLAIMAVAVLLITGEAIAMIMCASLLFYFCLTLVLD